MKKAFFILLLLVLSFYILVLIFAFFFQEKLIFFPEKLNKNYEFQFSQKFEEKFIEMRDGTKLHGLLFKTEISKGLVFYLHGNAGSLRSWGNIAKTYTNLEYDVFVLDYRGYGKSEGAINGEEQIFNDVQTIYDNLKSQYSEEDIIIIGHSIGTGPATKLASVNNPKRLILLTPYYSLIDMLKHNYQFLPTSILKYRFETNIYIENCKMPIALFHGDQDKVIYYGSSLKLEKQLKSTDKLITLKGQGHHGLTYNKDYKNEISKILK